MAFSRLLTSAGGVQSLWVSRVLKHPKKVFGGFDNVFRVYLFVEGIPKIWKKLIFTMACWATCKKAQPILGWIGNTFLHCPSLPSKSHHENSISSIFLESSHQTWKMLSNPPNTFWVFQYSRNSQCNMRQLTSWSRILNFHIPIYDFTTNSLEIHTYIP